MDHAIVAAVIAAVATITAVIIGGLIARKRRPAKTTTVTEQPALRLVDVAIVDTDEFPKLDIKTRNTGREVVFLKRVQFRVYTVWSLRPPILPAQVPASWNYNVLLPPTGFPYTESVDISQSVAPNAVDRFTFTLGHEGAPLGEVYEEFVYHMTLLIVYDEDDKTVQSKDVLLLMPSGTELLGSYSPGGKFAEECTEHNRQVLSEVKRIQAVQSKGLKRLIRVIGLVSRLT